MVWDADADSIVVIIVKMIEFWVFGKDEGEFARNVFIN